MQRHRWLSSHGLAAPYGSRGGRLSPLWPPTSSRLSDYPKQPLRYGAAPASTASARGARRRNYLGNKGSSCIYCLPYCNGGRLSPHFSHGEAFPTLTPVRSRLFDRPSRLSPSSYLSAGHSSTRISSRCGSSTDLQASALGSAVLRVMPCEAWGSRCKKPHDFSKQVGNGSSGEGLTADITIHTTEPGRSAHATQTSSTSDASSTSQQAKQSVRGMQENGNVRSSYFGLLPWQAALTSLRRTLAPRRAVCSATEAWAEAT